MNDSNDTGDYARVRQSHFFDRTWKAIRLVTVCRNPKKRRIEKDRVQILLMFGIPTQSDRKCHPIDEKGNATDLKLRPRAREILGLGIP